MEKRKTKVTKRIAAALAVTAAVLCIVSCGGKSKGGGAGGATVTVTYVTESGSTTVETNKGESIAAPDDPKKPSDERYTYEFYGWYTASGERYEFDGAVTEDMTLTARFYAAARKYKAVYVNGDETTEKETEYGAKAEQPTAPQKQSDERYNYEFDGWYTASGERYDFESEITGDVTLTARYVKTARLYTVRYIAGGSTEEERYEYGTKVDEPPAPEKADEEKIEYAFSGWYTHDGKKYDFERGIEKDAELYARYEARTKPKVTFVDNGITLTAQYIKSGGKAQRPNDPVRQSTAEYEYEFKQWNEGDRAYDFNKAVTEDITLTAEYAASKRRYTVTFTVGGALYEQTTAEYGSAVIYPEEPRDASGKVFTGWFAENDREWTSGATVEGNVTLTAKFEELFVLEENADGYTVTGIRKEQSGGILRIPETCSGRSVTEIGADAFSDETWIKEIILPEGIKRIGEYAFNNVGISRIALPESVRSIGAGAFIYCEELTEVRIGADVETIGEWAFTDCCEDLTIYYGGDAARWNDVAQTDYSLFGTAIVFGA